MNQIEDNIAVSVRDLSKEYMLGGVEQHYDSFRDLLLGMASAPFRRKEILSGKKKENLFLALDGINIDIPEGQSTGIIGRNGAGKSTLLKVLSKITKPTSGKVKMRGRVASLLEVGSGFHPELSGRENIFMNASILGMTRQEVLRKMDDIVAFAEVEKFLDTPVKRYSSGMYVRLAFSVAAHVDPDILLVDEVLAVGDAKFQQRCIGKLGEAGQQGRTVVFVSHNMGLIQELCSHTIYLKDGKVESYGETSSILPQYFRDGVENTGVWIQKDESACLRAVRVVDADNNNVLSIGYDQQCRVQIDIRPNRADKDFVIATRLVDELGRDILTSWDTDTLVRTTEIGRLYRVECEMPRGLLRPGRYFILIMIRNSNHGYLDQIEETTLELEVSNLGFTMNNGRFGVVLPTLKWDVSEL
jgi:lipopolysaccharide transport system ATP-binding protein